MQSGLIANNLTDVEHDLALINSDYGTQFVV
jgi:hypothetical protein